MKSTILSTRSAASPTYARLPPTQPWTAFSLLRVEHNPLGQSIKQLSNIPGFVEAFAVPGQFDIVALWQARTTEEIMKTSINQLTNVGGLFKSETLLAYAPVFKA